MKAIFLRCGISENVWNKHQHLKKFPLARAILSELDRAGDNGVMAQHRLVTEFAKILKLNYNDLPDPEGAKSALISLRALASRSVAIIDDKHKKSEERIKLNEEIVNSVKHRADGIEELRKKFNALTLSSEDPAGRGFTLEKILQDLFQIEGIEYHPPFRTGPEQLDGLFVYDSCHYLVEARWRKTFPTKGDLLEFRGKVDGKIRNTRGMFVSISGFREEVLNDMDKGNNPIILFDGRDLIEIFEGRVRLKDALDEKILQASKKGILFCPIY